MTSNTTLPIHASLPALKQVLAQSSCAVLTAPPGSGKTTIVPLALLDQPWLDGQRILLLEPRRLAARAAAARMADSLGEPVGEQVGYRVRLDSRVSSRTRIEVVTEGILTRRLQQDPELNGVGLVIFDEFHERSLQVDLGLALCLDVATGLREDLRLLVMSATLDTNAVSGLMGDAPVITGEGSCHPVDVHYLEREQDRKDIARTVAAATLRALKERDGDILVFLPGTREIRDSQRRLASAIDKEILLVPLYGDLDKAAQDRAILPDPAGRRRIVLATSIAETSLTIEGIDTVVDSGWSRISRFDPNSGLSRLETVRVSKAAAAQRSGRAGRLGPGYCYRLWTRATHASLPDHATAEIRQADLSSLVLELAHWGVKRIQDLRWLTAPPDGSYAQAQGLLRELDALDEKGRITAMGKRMLDLPVHPRLAHMLVQAKNWKAVPIAADIAALLSERDIFRRNPGAAIARTVDIEQRLQLLHIWRRKGGQAAASAGADIDACARVDRVSRQLLRIAGKSASGNPVTTGELLSLAYPERIAQRRKGGFGRYLLASGRGVCLPEGDALAGQPYLVAADLDAGRNEGRVYLAAALDEALIRKAKKTGIKSRTRVEWDSSSRSVIVREEDRLGAIVLASRPVTNPDPNPVREAMLVGIKEMGLDSLPWSRTATEWRARILSLRHWQPEAGWPDLSDQELLATLDEWLAPWLEGMSRQQHLKKLDLQTILRARLDWGRQQQMESLAPTHIMVPSGSRKRLQYRPGEAPVLQVRLQEMFGLGETPRICNHQVPVVLHLLSPAQRPIQVTQDLRGFWERTYKEVRKELKGRYPKHYWPENPWAAEATARVRPPGHR